MPIRLAEAAGKLHYKLADVGPTGDWGNPVDWKASSPQRTAWMHGYVGAVPPSECCFDLILVDGRFREACALHALLLSHNETVVLVHDNDHVQSRPYNRTLQEWYTVEQAGKLSVLRAIQSKRASATARSSRFVEDFSKRMHDPIRL